MEYNGKYYNNCNLWMKIIHEKCTNGFVVMYRNYNREAFNEFETSSRRAWFKELKHAKAFINFINDNPDAPNDIINLFIDIPESHGKM